MPWRADIRSVRWVYKALFIACLYSQMLMAWAIRYILYFTWHTICYIYTYTYILDCILIIILLLRIFHYHLMICLYCSLCRYVHAIYCIHFTYFTYYVYVFNVMSYNGALCQFLYLYVLLALYVLFYNRTCCKQFSPYVHSVRFSWDVSLSQISYGQAIFRSFVWTNDIGASVAYGICSKNWHVTFMVHLEIFLDAYDVTAFRSWFTLIRR